MHLDKYEYLADQTFASFMFQSNGPRGSIRKIVNYQEVFPFPDGRPVINLGFGDWDEDIEKVDDSILSNNQDRDKVLATIASTIVEYTDIHGKMPIYAQGNTPVKTRLYQMAMNAHLHDIEQLFWVFGLSKGNWTKFEPGINFEAFMIIRK
ncbi:DUF6934 family protein [Chitinophaga cymbidii]|uniref:Uncharacterized protein n=1 Tax=Chitinophaga cymbidii TaxID=1096750 RepID=A0A512RRU4_9BACT|nr:hypothetical protein [Chitinophaga cymbidii]GEP98418.1 hypothetical protein CCY01nite_46780 [Chitinophaga cymbidii]